MLSHGRDNHLLVWQLGPNDESRMEKALPVDTAASSASSTSKQPWLLYEMPVNALNFCSFAMCRDGIPQSSPSRHAVKDVTKPDPILFAVPNAVESAAVCQSFIPHHGPPLLCTARWISSSFQRNIESLLSTKTVQSILVSIDTVQDDGRSSSAKAS